MPSEAAVKAADGKYRPLVEAMRKLATVCHLDDVEPRVIGHLNLVEEVLAKLEEK